MSTITPEVITNIIGSDIKNVRRIWPLVIVELQKKNRNKIALQVALLATIGTECGGFTPINEMGSDAYFTRNYDITGKKPKLARTLGNLKPGDGARYHGRGLVQITGYYNYLAYGKAVGVDLIKNPEMANDDHVAVAILVRYALDHGMDVWADRAFRTDDDDIYPEEYCCQKLRRLVNGGLNGYDKFKKLWDKFKERALA